MPWACMTKDDEVSSIAFTDLFGPRRSGCELEGVERHRGLEEGSGWRKREDEDADKCRKGVEAK